MSERAATPGSGSETRRTMTEARLLEALDAWNSHDTDQVISYMANDCSYYASFGPELLGSSYVGRDQVRQGVEQFFASYPDAQFLGTEVVVSDDRGSAEWTLEYTNADGTTKSQIRGCDLFLFDGDLIKVKNAFRKSRSQ
jgi:hypothetical protein